MNEQELLELEAELLEQKKELSEKAANLAKLEEQLTESVLHQKLVDLNQREKALDELTTKHHTRSALGKLAAELDEREKNIDEMEVAMNTRYHDLEKRHTKVKHLEALSKKLVDRVKVN
jgi:hypothetical protein